MKILYISYDGMTDPLGQSQVLPYLCGLSERGYEITLLSCEKAGNFELQKQVIKSIVATYGISWEYITYTKRPPVLSTLWDVLKLKGKAFKLSKQQSFGIVHCRSYIAALVGLSVKKRFGTKFIFDMRGFWADERVDGHIWNIKNPLFKAVYCFFKKKEKQFLLNADYTVSLTRAAKQEIENNILGSKINIEVIPCCADTKHFSLQHVNAATVAGFRNKLKIQDTDFILTYLGSIGTWYMLPEMLAFFKELSGKIKNAKFLFITQENEDIIRAAAAEQNIVPGQLIVCKASRNELPGLLGLSKLAVFFIKPSYSKMASSPTKMAELMAMGIPIICNAGVGDNDHIMQHVKAGAMVNEFTLQEYNRVISQIDAMTAMPKQDLIDTADRLFSLEKGIDLYESVYQKLAIRDDKAHSLK